MDSGSTRRAAEKAACDLTAARSAVIGGLAAQHAEFTRSRQAADAARTRGDQLVYAARQHAQQLIENAGQHSTQAQTRYAGGHTAARDGGWPTTDLTAPRHPSPDGPGSRSTAAGPRASPKQAAPAPVGPQAQGQDVSGTKHHGPAAVAGTRDDDAAGAASTVTA